MSTIFLRTRTGQELELTAEIDHSLMEIIRSGGVDELLALCGGCCSCATCHVYVANDTVIATQPIGADEDDLLESSSYRTPESRLSCQIRLTPALDGLRVTIAPED